VANQDARPAGASTAGPPAPGARAAGPPASVFAMHIRARLEYRVDFLTGVLHGIGFQLVGLVFIWTVLHRFPDLAGWTFGEVAFLYALRLLSHSLYLPFLSNVTEIAELVRNGGLDRLLLRPVHPLLLVVTRTFQINAVGNVLTSVAVFWVAQNTLGIEWTPGRVLYLALALLGGVLIEAGVHLFLSSLAVWIVDTRRLNSWVGGLFNSFGNYPLTIYNHALQFGFTFVLPLAFVAYFPATLLLDREDEGAVGLVGIQPLLAYATPVVGVVVFGLAMAFFAFALRRYRSTGH
jgi:ABC-2 type transport system permease protein